jgi:predicted SprT family Zn-dependent metalloprotease|tara:strand:+ start:1266 stop:1616 length:351 start_codon:yes stop_codon:yes gene_type:complete
VAKARKKLDRLRQLHAWMQSRYATPHPTTLRFVRQCADAHGYVEMYRRKLRITLVQTAPFYHLVMILIHEYAHCMAWGHHKVPKPDHGAEWSLAMGEIYRELYEGDGWRQSCEVKW